MPDPSRAPDERQVVGLLEESVFGEPGSLRADMSLDAVEGWDSSSMVFFTGEASGRWGIELSADDLRDCSVVADLVVRVRRKAAP